MAQEKQFEKKVEKYLASVGVYQAGTPSNKMEVEKIGWFTKIWGGGYQKSGIPDLLLCVNGFFISVELKAPNGEASDLQKMNTARINQSNGIGIILFPDGFEQFKEIMKGVMECKCHIAELNYLKTALTSTKCDILTKY
mgnify:CR=1 FL=1|nr:VRR-NUC domain-containing protein [uncultured Anaerocolumna sp.]